MKNIIFYYYKSDIKINFKKMWLEDYSPDIDSVESWWWQAEASKEVSEKFKDAVKKASAWIKRTKKDEKKAQKHDLLLANFLVKFIIDKRYDDILQSLLKALNSWYPSNIILWILSIIDIEISHKIRELTWQKKIQFNYIVKEEEIEFDDENIDIEIRERINNWFEDINSSVSIEYSNLLTKKLLESIKVNQFLLDFCSMVFMFFLDSININISHSKALWICEFILSEIEKTLKTLEIEET